MIIRFLPLLFLCACASTEEEGPISKAHPASYGSDSFTVEQPMPKRESKKMQFYFKDCSATDGKDYYSATSYYCDDLNQ